MILFDVVIVAVSNAPQGLLYVYLVSKINMSRTTSMESLISVLTQLLSATQAFGSFYFYLIVSTAFRNNVSNMLWRLFGFWKVRRRGQIIPLPGTIIAIHSKIPNVVV